MYEFAIELAGVPILVQCRHKENQLFFREYMTRKEPELRVFPQEEDLDKIRKDMEDYSSKEGFDPFLCTPALQERNAIHMLVCRELLSYQVLLMHGSALCMDGEAYVFIASSGTGKSTHARFWREVFGDRVWMINDDKPLLKVEKDCVRVYGSPWNGKHRLGRNACAPLKALVHLKRDSVNQIRKLRKPEGFPILLEHSLWSGIPAERVQILKLQQNVLNMAQLYELRCTPSADAAAAAWQGINDADQGSGEPKKTIS